MASPHRGGHESVGRMVTVSGAICRTLRRGHSRPASPVAELTTLFPCVPAADPWGALSPGLRRTLQESGDLRYDQIGANECLSVAEARQREERRTGNEP